MKTIKEWLEELPEPYRSEAIYNASINPNNGSKHNLKAALLGAFVWCETPQGHKYWGKLWESL